MSDMPYTIDKTDKHYWLYAKGWYEKSDNYLDDLLKIHSNWCGFTLEKNDSFWIVNKLTEIAFNIIMNNNSRYQTDLFQEFLFDLAPNNCWRIGANDKVYSFDEAIIKKCLSIMRFTTTYGLDPEFDIDETILPKHNHKKEN